MTVVTVVVVERGKTKAANLARLPDDLVDMRKKRPQFATDGAPRMFCSILL